jgi:hypothetical protein
MSSSTTVHTGGCHCGRVRFEVATDLAQIISCNCSICTKRGLLLSFVKPEAFKLLAGEDALREYLFNTRRIAHQHCADCGTEPFARGVAPSGHTMIALNVRCLDNIDVSALSLHPFDGKSL